MASVAADQQQLVHSLLQVTLSQSGYDRVMASVDADEYLKSQSGNHPLQFGADNYSVVIFGTPSTTQAWMFRFRYHNWQIGICWRELSQAWHCELIRCSSVSSWFSSR